MSFEETKKRVEQADLAAKQERLKSPEVIQKTKAVRRGGSISLGKKKLFRWIGEPSGWPHHYARGCVPCIIDQIHWAWLYEDPAECPPWQSGHSYSVGDIIWSPSHPDFDSGMMMICTQAHSSNSSNRPPYGENWQDYWDETAIPVWLCEGSNPETIPLNHDDPIWGIELESVQGPLYYGGLLCR